MKHFESEIRPSKYFSKEILNYRVKIKGGSFVNYVNLDNAATTPPLSIVEQKVKNYLISYGSVHRGSGSKSKISTDIYEKSRKIIKDFVKAPQDAYVIFSGNTTGGINTAAHFFSFLPGKIMVSAVEHSSSWLPWIKAEGIKQLGVEQISLKQMEKANDKIQKLGKAQVIQYDVNDNFEFDLKSIERVLKTNKVKLLVATASSNITGYCPDIKAIGKLAHKYGAYFLVDACQYLQHHVLDMRKLGIDFLVASGHKFYAPYGGGFLIGPKKFLDNFLSYQIGGGNLPYITENGKFLRYKNQMAHDPGTPNAVGAVAIMYALQAIKKIGLKNIERHEKRLSKKLFDYLISNPKVEVYVSEKHLSTILPFNIKDRNAIDVAEILNNNYGIGVRAGSFCVYQVLRKLLNIKDERKIVSAVKNGKPEKIPALIRASIGLGNTNKDINRMIEAIKDLTQ